MVSSSAHEKLKIAEANDREADRDIEKWTFDTNKMTITYYDKVGNVMSVEEIK